ncbi:protein kinase domain-containing protein [Pengzhenrongella sp.]|jgi:hypothetical protein|uniref:protein kinase domain-containing protein n=1 Tax=Pengzhenrongella sp. TaxID=2888820 RepID=UPI002F93FBE4
MQPDVVPPDLAAALLAAGYRVGGPAGVGSQCPAWSASAVGGGPEARTRVVVTMLAVPTGPGGDGIRARLDTLRALRHEHLAEVVDVVPVSGTREAGRWAVLLAEVAGPNLEALLAARPPLAAGEAVTLVVPLAGALAALHDAGLVHGDVSPANVVVRPDGRPVLVDLLGAVTADAGSRAPRGTPGFAAPEVESGARPGPAGDVHALARVALAALETGSGLALRAALEGACTRVANDRPSAAELAARCYAAATPEPLDLPDAAVLARTTLARLATESSPRSAVTRQPPGSRHRADRRRWRTAVLTLAVAAGVAVCGALAAGVLGPDPADGGRTGPSPAADAPAAHRSPGTDAPSVAAIPRATSKGVPSVEAGPTLGDGVTSGAGATSSAGPSSDADQSSDPDPSPGADPAPGARSANRSDPVAAAVALTEQRATALTTGDPAALDDVELAGAAAHTADVQLLAGLRAAGLRIDGLKAEVVNARLVETARTTARVEVTSSLTAHRRLSADGGVVAEVAAQPARAMVLELAWTPAGWRVVSVTEPESGTDSASS